MTTDDAQVKTSFARQLRDRWIACLSAGLIAFVTTYVTMASMIISYAGIQALYDDGYLSGGAKDPGALGMGIAVGIAVTSAWETGSKAPWKMLVTGVLITAVLSAVGLVY